MNNNRTPFLNLLHLLRIAKTTSLVLVGTIGFIASLGGIFGITVKDLTGFGAANSLLALGAILKYIIFFPLPSWYLPVSWSLIFGSIYLYNAIVACKAKAATDNISHLHHEVADLDKEIKERLRERHLESQTDFDKMKSEMAEHTERLASAFVASQIELDSANQYVDQAFSAGRFVKFILNENRLQADYIASRIMQESKDDALNFAKAFTSRSANTKTAFGNLFLGIRGENGVRDKRLKPSTKSYVQLMVYESGSMYRHFGRTAMDVLSLGIFPQIAWEIYQSNPRISRQDFATLSNTRLNDAVLNWFTHHDDPQGPTPADTTDEPNK